MKKNKERERLRAMTRKLAELDRMSCKELVALWEELFEKPTRSRNMPYLRKRLAWKIQEQAEGGLSDRAKDKAAELAKMPAPPPKRTAKSGSESKGRARDPRLPKPGAVLTREHKGAVHEVKVLERGFEYAGQEYRSLSAIAKEITGTTWNGLSFFGLNKGTSR